MARSALLSLLALGAMLAPAASAFGQEAPVALPPLAAAAAAPQPDMWATVNICDTPGSPNSLGIRASMPGADPSERLFMRFTAQYWSSERQEWTTVDGAGISPWLRVGLGVTEGQQTGWTFRFDQPPPGVTFTMRGRVELEWRKPSGQTARRARKAGHARKAGRAKARRSQDSPWTVVRQRVRVTETGILGVDGGDPAGTSKAMCLLY